jgi:hypothetical protein
MGITLPSINSGSSHVRGTFGKSKLGGGMSYKRLCAAIALAVMVVACSGKETESGGTAGTSGVVTSDFAQATAGQSSASSASQAAALAEDKWKADWRQKYLAGRDGQKDRAAIEQAVERELSAQDADPSDIAAKAQLLGRDPQKTFEFMRDQIRVEPYAGVLRGARGTLMAGSGNALDRSLLAQELLKAQGLSTRLVTGQLSETQVQTLLDHFLNAGLPPDLVGGHESTAKDMDVDQIAMDIAAKIGLQQEAIAELLTHAQQREEAFRSRTSASTSEQFDSLNRLLPQDRRRVPLDVTALHSALMAKFGKHYWIQVRGPNGNWSDFDPTFPDATLGTRYASKVEVLTEIPAGEYHELQFSLVYFAVREGEKTEDVLVSGRVHSSEALFEPVSFTIQPNGGSDVVEQLAAEALPARVQSLKELRRFQGVLKIGSELIVSRSFDLEGNIFDSPDAPLPLSQATSLADALGGDSQTPPQFRELQVVLQQTGPDRDQRTQIRTLVRGEDAQSPTFAPPLMAWELLLQPQWVSPKWVAINALRQLLMATRATPESTAAEGQEQIASMRLLQLALQRQETLAATLGSNGGVAAMVDEPQLTIYGYRLSGLKQQPDEIRSENFIDLVENGVRFIPNDASTVAKAYEQALTQSAADSALESGVLGILHPGTAPISGLSVFKAAQSNGRPPFLASSRDVDLLRTAGVSESDIEWIYDNESPDTRLLVAVAPNGSTAWWSVRQDGVAVLRMNGGRGSAISEDAIVRTKYTMMAICTLTTIATFACEGTGAGLASAMLCATTSNVSLLAIEHSMSVRHGFSLFMIAAEVLEQGLHVRNLSHHCSSGH